MPHKLNLLCSLVKIVLVDTYSVGPNTKSRDVSISELIFPMTRNKLQGNCEADGDRDSNAFDLDLFGEICIASDVRKGIENRFVQKRNSMNSAFD
jgi:hypothetical protein